MFDFSNTKNLSLVNVSLNASKEIPVFVHILNLTQIAKMILFIKQHPNAIIIIGHLCGVELFIKEEKEYFKNTYFDLSNFYFVSQERTIMAYQNFGPKHLLMGSDTPYGKQSLENTIQQICSLKIPSADKERILGQNLAKLLKL